MALSEDHELVGGVTHFTGDGVSGGGGRAVGARIDCVKSRTAGEMLGGMTKCRASSLRSIRRRYEEWRRTYTPTTK